MVLPPEHMHPPCMCVCLLNTHMHTCHLHACVHTHHTRTPPRMRAYTPCTPYTHTHTPMPACVHTIHIHARIPPCMCACTLYVPCTHMCTHMPHAWVCIYTPHMLAHTHIALPPLPSSLPPTFPLPTPKAKEDATWAGALSCLPTP